MTKRWQLQEAKNKFSAVVKEAVNNDPQVVTKYDKDAVVILSIEEYQRLTGQHGSLIDFFNSSPLKGIKLDIKRESDLGREIDL